jgi:1-acyl-sn-glycerol-3-phosphate acyltransferase
MVIADIARVILVVSIPIVIIRYDLNFYIYPVVFLLGISSSLFLPAKMALITNITEKEQLLPANSLIITTTTLASLIGTLLAGFVIKFTNLKVAFFLNALTYLFSAILVWQIKIDPSIKIQEAKNIYRAFFDDIKKGLDYMDRHQLIMRLIQLSCILSILASIFYISLLNYGASILKANSLGMGILLSGLGLGMALGSVYLLKIKSKVNFNTVLYLAFFIIGFFNLLFIWRPSFAVTSLFLVLIGIGASLLMISLDTIMQKIVPDELKGKIFGLRGFATNLTFLLSIVLVGWLVKVIPATKLFGLVAILSLTTGFFIYLADFEWGYQLFRASLKTILIWLFKLKVTGSENLPQKQKVILAGNHTSLLDGLIVMAAYPHRIYFLAHQKIFKRHFFSWAVRQLGFVPVRVGGVNKEAILESLRILHMGKSIGIFPEGKITEDGNLAEAKRGMEIIAHKTDVPIVPFAIEGAYEAWPLNKPYPKPYPVEIRFGKPIYIQEIEHKGDLTDELMQDIAQIKKEMEREGYLRVEPSEIIRHLIYSRQD